MLCLISIIYGHKEASQEALVVKNLTANAETQECRVNPWVGKITCSRAWQLTPVFFPEESHRQRSLAGYGPQGRTELDMNEASWHTHMDIEA